MTPKEMIEVLQAFEAGKAIEFRHKNDCSSCWFSCNPSWDFSKFDYRVKPEPMVIWVNAKLIAAAPDLLAACQAVESLYPGDTDAKAAAFTMVAEAIRKATE